MVELASGSLGHVSLIMMAFNGMTQAGRGGTFSRQLGMQSRAARP